jgi:two-component system chemotaxis response regulator CheB
MDRRNIIVIGASAGGFDALKTLISGLPADLDASIFIVWHMSPDLRGILPQVLNRVGGIYAANALDKELIVPNRIYVAPPDHHLLIENGTARVTRGPKENRFRPAVDPLFRSAAYAYGARIIGVVLSGALDDGTSGLWTIKDHGGIAIVQEPRDAAVPSMPENALKEVAVDYKVPVADMAELLTRLSAEPVPTRNMEEQMEKDQRTELEIRIATGDNSLSRNAIQFGEPTPYACPECHGVLSALKEGRRIRFRCHTGHAYSANSLLIELTSSIEDSLWNAIRGIEESIILLNHMGDHFAETNQPKLAAGYFLKAREADQRMNTVRQVVFSHEQLSRDKIEVQAAHGKDA